MNLIQDFHRSVQGSHTQCWWRCSRILVKALQRNFCVYLYNLQKIFKRKTLHSTIQLSHTGYNSVVDFGNWRVKSSTYLNCSSENKCVRKTSSTMCRARPGGLGFTNPFKNIYVLIHLRGRREGASSLSRRTFRERWSRVERAAALLPCGFSSDGQLS
jgi:hypothetical protein